MIPRSKRKTKIALEGQEESSTAVNFQVVRNMLYYKLTRYNFLKLKICKYAYIVVVAV